MSGTAQSGAKGLKLKKNMQDPTRHTGTRIREKRLLLGVKQADLARAAAISPAYLNLIEHNRRRIGGKLLLDLARALDVDAASFTQDTQSALLEGLHEAAQGTSVEAAIDEGERAIDFASRFPQWAALVVQQKDQMIELNGRVEALNDRLSHDPFLSSALHEVLSTVTAIRSTAGILNAEDDIDHEWRVRFHRNMYEESQRLAEGAQALVSYLDAVSRVDETGQAPLDEVAAWASQTSGVEASGAKEASEKKVVLSSPAAQSLASKWTLRAAQDTSEISLSQVEASLSDSGPDPAMLARLTGCSLPAAMRRLASLPVAPEYPALGLLMCDASGALSFRKPLDGFAPPKTGAACPLWPLYQSLLRPTMPVRRIISQGGVSPRSYLAFAVAEPVGAQGFDEPDIFEATMLFMALDEVENKYPQLALPATEGAFELGTTCRVCVRETCAARREPSLMRTQAAQHAY
jgi:predicted transcriptional regulator/transcriptional regulator with XRE-family HTH domain